MIIWAPLGWRATLRVASNFQCLNILALFFSASAQDPCDTEMVFKGEKLSTEHNTRGSFTTQKKSIPKKQRLHLQFLLQRKRELPQRIQRAQIIEPDHKVWTFKKTVFVLTWELLFLCYARMSSCHMTSTSFCLAY